MSVPSDEGFENTHKILCIQAKERLRKYPGIQLLGNLFECEIQLEEQISQVYVVLKNTMEKRKEVIKKIDEGVAMFSGAALLAGVATVGAFIVKHIKWGNYYKVEWKWDTHLDVLFLCYHNVELMSYCIKIIIVFAEKEREISMELSFNLKLIMYIGFLKEACDYWLYDVWYLLIL